MRVGFHVSKKSVVGGKKARKIADAVPEDMKLVVDRGLSPIAQIFVCGPQQAVETLSAADKKWLSEHHEFPTVIHGAYIDHPWTESQKSLDNIALELNIAAIIGATGVVVHLGSGAHDEETFHRVVAQCIAGANNRESPILWLETQSAKATPWTYETPEKMRGLCERVASYEGAVGICIDTAHLFACGASLTSRDEAATIFDVLDAFREIPVMIHLNDSASTQGSGKDRHAGLCTGNIWRVYATGGLPIEESGLAYIVQWANRRASDGRRCDVILERDHDPSSDLDIISRLIVGYQL